MFMYHILADRRTLKVRVVTQAAAAQEVYTAPADDVTAVDRYRVRLLDEADARGWTLHSERRQEYEGGVTFVYLWQCKPDAPATPWAWPDMRAFPSA